MSDIHKIGTIIGETNPIEFLFATTEKVSRLEYILIESNENVNGEEIKVNIIAQVFQIMSSSRALMEYIKLEDAERIIQAGLVDTRTFAGARVLGFLHEGNIYQPRRAIQPGKPVYLAPKELLEKFYSYSKEEGLHVGNLITRPDVPVHITLKGFRRHLAILAQTGAGKSYTAGVLVEELLEKGATVIIIDPHADYVFLGKKRKGGMLKRVNIFRTPESTGRYDETQIGKKIETYQIRFSDLSQNEIETICGIREGWIKLSDALSTALSNLQSGYELKDLLRELDNLEKNGQRVKSYIRRLSYLKVFGPATTDYKEFLKPKQVSVIDLSGLDDNVSDYVNYRILRDIYHEAETQNLEYPVFVLIEEAHRFIPAKDRTLSKQIVKRIAAEGRKFGIFLILITQRPYKIDQDVLSQCNSQIIMRMTNPEDQKAIKTSSERISEDLLVDLPGLNIGEAVVIGEISKAPVMIKVRPRLTEEGGGDIDIVAKLKEAREEAEIEAEKREEQLRKDLEDMRKMLG